MAYDNPVNKGWQAAGQVVNDVVPLAGTAKMAADLSKSVPGTWDSFSQIASGTPSLTQTAANKLASSAGFNGTESGLASSIANWVGPAIAAYDYANTGLSNAMTRDLSDWRNGAATGALLGSVAGPLGTLAGAVAGAGAGLVGKAAGIGKTTNEGYTPISGVYNQGGQMSMLGTGGTGAKRYASYNDAMNYLNGVNQMANSDWSNIGDSEQGRYRLSTKTFDPANAAIGLASNLGTLGMGGAISNKHKDTYVDAYNANLNTGYNVMDDFVNGRNYSGDTWNLDKGWDPYRQQQDAIFQDRLGNLSRANEAGIVNSMRNNVNDLVTNTDQRQYDMAKNTLDQQYARGYMTQRQYQQALNQLNQNRIANRQSLSDIGTSQLDQWKTDVKQAYQNKMDQDLTDAWIKNYDAWKADDLSGLYGKASDAAQAYLNNVVSDDYLKSLMMQTSMYTPEQYMATGVSNAIDDNLGRWYGNRQKRNAPLVYEGE